MARTFNRPPVVVNTPSASDVKSYFFNHSNWKGLTDNKNLLAVDQESFADANNVYVNEEGLLRSRPSLKCCDTEIEHTWVYSNISAILYTDKKLVILYDNDKYELSNIEKEFKIVLFENRLLIFFEDDLKAFNLDTKSFESVEQLISVPITKVISQDGETTSFDKNELSESEIYSYLYGLIDENGNFLEYVSSKIYDNTVYLKNDTSEWYFKFTTDSRYSIVETHSLTDFNFANDDVDNLRISFSDIGTCVLFNYKYETNNANLYYSIDGNNFLRVDMSSLSEYESLDELVVVDANISIDGYHIAILTSKNAYIKSIVNNGKRFYTNWTPLLKTESVNIEDAPEMPYTHAYNDVSIYVYVIDDQKTQFRDGDSICMFSDDCYAIAQTTYSEYSTTAGLNSVQGWMSYLLYKVGDHNMYFTLNPVIDASYSIGFTKNAGKILLDVNEKQCCVQYASKYSSTESYTNVLISVTTSTTSNVTTQLQNGYAIVKAAEMRKQADDTLQMNYCKLFKNFAIFVATRTFTATTSNRTGILYIDTTTNDFDHTRSMFENISDFSVISNNLRYYGSSTHFQYSSSSDLSQSAKHAYAFNNRYNAAVVNDDSVLLIRKGESTLIFETNKLSYPKEIYQKINFTSADADGKPKYTLFIPDAYETGNNLFISKRNKLYISHSSLNNDSKLYFPKIQSHEFTEDITGLNTISPNDTAIFFEDAIYYATFDAETQVKNYSGVFRYFKTKLSTGVKRGGDIITSFDGKYVVFATKRGLASMSYQDFIASDEQSLTYISDTIYFTFDKFINDSESTNEIKLFKHAFWIFVYKQDSNVLYLFDIRNNSWWKFTYFVNVKQLLDIHNNVHVLLDNTLYKTDNSDIEYYDTNESSKQSKIEWFIKSQKLHLNAINYYKHIVNLTFTSVHDLDQLHNAEYNVDQIDYKLQVNNYRKTVSGTVDTDEYIAVNYTVNSAKTFVQRVNYSKVNEFQYVLSSNEENVIEIPLSMNAITIKYKIGSQVR